MVKKLREKLDKQPGNGRIATAMPSPSSSSRPTSSLPDGLCYDNSAPTERMYQGNNHQYGTERQYQPPPDPPLGHNQHGKNTPGYQPPSGPPPGKNQNYINTTEYQPPPGPPPRHNQHLKNTPEYQPPPDPPPKYNQYGRNTPEYQPPPGPPPGHNQNFRNTLEYQPPPGPPQKHDDFVGNAPRHQPALGPPPSWQTESGSASLESTPAIEKSDTTTEQSLPPPYHNWTIIPDYSLLPPPPNVGYYSSPASNANEDEGEQAYSWTFDNPLWPPQTIDNKSLSSIHASAFALVRPPQFTGNMYPIKQKSPGTWWICSRKSQPDCTVLTSFPLYVARYHSPVVTRADKRTIYFEIEIQLLENDSYQNSGANQSTEEATASVSIGFVAPPYPTWRQPGWQRGSLAVHGDDGRRFVNDTFGGIDFTTAFKPDQTVGIGITFGREFNPNQLGPHKLDSQPDITRQPHATAYHSHTEFPPLTGRVFFTRDGREEGAWDLHEQLDERIEGGIIGLEGNFDLFPAIGIFGAVQIQTKFHPAEWLFRVPQ